jgi:hypothetical protein
MGWGEPAGPDRDQLELQAAAKLAAAVRKYQGWRSTRNEQEMLEALAEYDATITPGPAGR